MGATAELAAAPDTERYEVLGLLGRGGMGAVYRARDRNSEQVIALKRLLVAVSDSRRKSLTELFHQEFRTLAQLEHPHVVRAYDFGIDEHGPYYTMELLEGEELHALSPLPWRETCALLRDVCSAAALLHSRRLVHRDLSPKNMQRTRDRRAKLLDFGAMAPMGPSKTVVGTPPLVPPEAIMQQPLDGRADLYALGGTLYYVLTGGHAYPARSVSQLRELWRRPLAPPSARVPDVPPELDALVLSLLSPDPAARPRSAAELIDRLTAIAALGEDEQLAVSHAYLSTPELVGREQEVARVRSRLGELIAGRGGALVLEGASGTGRSRMLDTAVLEAKLAGIAVARASAADGGSGYGTISALLRQLCDVLPAEQRITLGAGGALGLLERGEISAEEDKSRRAELQAVFTVLLRSFARTQPLLLAVDDIERCDEPSQAALAAATQAFRRERVLVAATIDADVRHDDGALALLQSSALRVSLAPLPASDTEALLGSVFGDVPYLQGLSARIHARAEGSPRGCMELAQHLKERGIVHYRMGSWVLPAELDEAALPSSLSRARRMKLEALSDDARELGAALAVAEGSGLDFEAFDALTSHHDRDRVRKALDELLLVQVLRSDGVRYLFEAQVWVSELRALLSPEQSRALHARVAVALAERGRDRLDVARYLWRAGEAEHTVDTLLAELAVGTRWDRSPADYGEILHGAADACLALGRSRRDRFLLLHEIVHLGQDLALPDMRARMVELFAQLKDDSGLSDWERLDPSLEALPRLQRALELAQQRHDTAPAQARGFAPLEAVVALARLISDVVAVAAQTGDAAMFEMLPPLVPFFPLSPVIERLQTLSVPASQAVVAGCYERAKALYLESLARLQEPGQLDETLRLWGIRAIHYAIGSIDAGLGRDQAIVHAEELDKSPGWIVPAWTVRLSYHLTIGNMRQADRCRKQIELLLLQSPVKPPLSAGAVHQHVFAFSLADNLTGMRRAVPEMERLARTHATLAPFVPFVRAEHARICGNYEEALVLLDETQRTVVAGRHPLWPWVMSSRLATLLGLGRVQDAYALGMRELETARAIGLDVMSAHIDIPLALAEARLGKFEAACERIDRSLSRREQLGMRGVVLGWPYEARARIALCMDDAQTFDKYAHLCAQQYRKAEGDPALAAKYERLMQEARSRGVSLRAELVDAMASNTTVAHTTLTTSIDAATAVALHSLSACTSRADRARQALDLLVASAGATEGELYMIESGKIVLAAATAEGLGADDIRAALGRLIDGSQEGADDGEEDDENTSMLTLRGPARPDGDQDYVWPLLLTCTRIANNMVAGVVALHFEPDKPVRLPFELASVIADALVSAGDVPVVSRVVSTPAERAR